MNKGIKFDLLDPDKLVKMNELKEITNPTVFRGSNQPSDDGLLSNSIFGITMHDRGNTFAYIDLHGWFLHPLVYLKWGRMDRSIKDLVHGQEYFKIGTDGYLVKDENGETGIEFLRKNINKIKIRRTESRKRDDDIRFIERNKKNLFINKCIVIPAYYRDVNTDDGYIGIGEINSLYNSLLVSTKALKDTDDYGIPMSDTINGRVQETLLNIYDWFTDEPNLSKKKGIIRRAVMSKSTDYASRLVISAPSLEAERPEDLKVNLDYTLLPLSSLCTNFFPYVVFHLRNFFQNEFSANTYPYKDKDGSIKYVTPKDPDIHFSDDRIKEEIDRFIRGFSNRLIPIQVPNEEGIKISMRFKGRKVPLDKLDNPGNTPILDRKLTWCDLIYIAVEEAVKDKHILITRYPLSDYFGQFPTKIRVGSTIETEPMFIDDKLYRFYPKIRDTQLNINTSHIFEETAQMSNLFLPAIGGDYDGDTVTIKGVYTIESNDELDKHVDSKAQYIGVNGINVRTSAHEAVQAIYNMTKVKDESRLTNPVF